MPERGGEGNDAITLRDGTPAACAGYGAGNREIRPPSTTATSKRGYRLSKTAPKQDRLRL
jgi:hypothetical protein